MIKVLHGDNIVESRKALLQMMDKVKKDGGEIVSLNGHKITLAEVRNSLESGSFFGDKRLVVMENLLSSLKSSRKNEIIEYLKTKKFDNDLVLWEGKEAGKTGLPPKSEVLIFKISPVIFQFLESLKPGNSKTMLEFLVQVKQADEPEMIFYMLIRQFRLLIMAKDLGEKGLSEISPWQKNKFLNQAKSFTLEQLKEIYKKLLEIDFKQKTSGDSYKLSSRLDLLVAAI